MAFDQSTRNRLARFVSDTRALLTEEFTRQLQHVYGLDPETGDVTDPARLTLDNVQRETARLLRETMEHYLASADTSTAAKAKKTRQETLDRIVREQAFTVLNRLCALRMAEARGLLIESIAKGYQSKGFQLYQRLAGTALGETGDCYRVFLFSVFDEFAVDLPVLFDRFSPQGRLFPRETALLAVLDQINHPDIDPLWAEDETIGWIYQYFNSVEERRQMRAESQAPRNSRELAVRNQFFTPRYVVEFLTDNTLGRIWYEMTKGQTALKDSCRYLIRRPNEIFLAEGEEAPKPPEGQQPAEDLSQEELLKQPVYIPHRPLKDPRDIKMLDPACGSMHFGLYAFDLFERIYDEAWDLEAERGPDAFVRPEDLKPLRETYDSKEAFLRDVPRLIIERNIHGIDIDPRAVQIAGLSLWLRAQKSWQAQGIKAQDRPQIQRSNIVCAEPMPGEADMLEEFLKGLREDRLESLIRRVLAVPDHQQVRATARMAEALCDLVRTVWKEMELAGEAGSLLKIEESLADAIAKGKHEWEAKLPLFRVTEFGLTEESQTNPKVKYYKTVPGEEEEFWDRAEALVLTALEDYAEHAQGSVAARRRMFAADAARGFALVDLCRKAYDTCLMNPPFGAGASSTKTYLASYYPTSKSNLYAMFVDRALEVTPNGMVGVISNRTGFFLDTLTDWRKTLLTGSRPLHAYADLGDRVLDALVEAAAYTVQSPGGTSPTVFFRLLSSDDKASDLEQSVQSFNNGEPASTTYYHSGQSFGIFPATRMSYWTPRPVRLWFESLPSLHSQGVNVQVGLSTKDDFRFLRLAWEVSPEAISTERHAACRAHPWMFLAKGGEYSPYFGDVHLVANWADDAKELSAAIAHKYPYLAHNVSWVLHPEVPYGSPGLTYTRRTTSGFSPRILPAGALISDTGATLYPQEGRSLEQVQAIAMSRVFGYLLELAVAAGDSVHAGSAARTYEIGIVGAMPSPDPSSVPEATAEQVRVIWQALFVLDSQRETSRYFSSPFAGGVRDCASLKDIARCYAQRRSALFLAALQNANASDSAVRKLYGVDDKTDALIADEFGPDVCGYPQATPSDLNLIRKLWRKRIPEIQQVIAERRGFARFVTKQTYLIDQRLELICHATQSHPKSVLNALEDEDVLGELLPELAYALTSCCVGAAMKRWAISTIVDGAGEAEFDPRRRIPTIPPAALMDPGDNELDHGCPDGILVDDDAARCDVTGSVRHVLETVWPKACDTIEGELVAALGGGTLRSYLNSPNRFFAAHLSMYSKSRRCAPIYWPLSTPSGSYTLWLYYHRLTDQTLYTCVNDFVDPKLKQVSEEADRLRGKSHRSSAEEKELERLADLELELKDFRDELLRVAKFWKPNLNDGVQITAAPLWKLFRHRQWRNRLKETWEKLEAGEYDWAHLALSIWPERVVRACQKDRSYAIAHDLEDQLWHEVEVEKVGRGGRVTTTTEWQPRDLSEVELNEIIDEVKAR